MRMITLVLFLVIISGQAFPASVWDIARNPNTPISTLAQLAADF